MLIIRPEAADDHRAIFQLTEAAFRGRPYADGDEQEVVDRLRAAGALFVSLVAERDGEVVGHIAFSPMVAADGSSPWFALGPVSVLPAWQGQGIGAALIVEGLARIAAEGALGCALTGNPDYYRRFGFVLAPANVPANEPVEFFMLKPLRGAAPDGALGFHSAFYDA